MQTIAWANLFRVGTYWGNPDATMVELLSANLNSLPDEVCMLGSGEQWSHHGLTRGEAFHLRPDFLDFTAHLEVGNKRRLRRVRIETEASQNIRKVDSYSPHLDADLTRLRLSEGAKLTSQIGCNRVVPLR